MIQKPKGTYDVYGEQGKLVLYIEEVIKALMDKYNYEYFRTPLFENTELYHRSVGENSDIITKETYDFKDKGDRELTLRPEGTAGIVRSFIENKYYAMPDQPVKVFYYGPMYRYERPQSLRYREFYQFGVEVMGSNNPLLDAEVISIPVNLYKLLGLKNIKVKINSLGDNESRANYREALKEYFKPYLNDLCEDCKVRYEKNPLRLLDCKVDMDKDFVKSAPHTLDYLNEESKKHFNDVKKYLDLLNIDYEISPCLVRGLDYYTHTVFEVEADIKDFGSNNVLCGGGRYNNLAKEIGDIDTPSVGFAMGLERLYAALKSEEINNNETKGLDAYVIPVSNNELDEVVKLVDSLRLNGFSVEMDYMNRNLKSNFKVCDRINPKFIIIIGEEEVKSGILTIKDNITKEETKVNKEELIDYLDVNI